ncbi:hypothetical protein X753_32475 [Mesorhizobium sp. LNJC399B00]|nr:hypothetical protein X753_32475 [Mesorhizobium sp. LNJC399B00]
MIAIGYVTKQEMLHASASPRRSASDKAIDELIDR